MNKWNTFDTPIPDTVKMIVVQGSGFPVVLVRRGDNWYDVYRIITYEPSVLPVYWRRWYPLPEINDENN